MLRNNFAAYLKVEQEVENDLLTSTIVLGDGTLGKLFSRSTRNESGVFLYNCQLCRVVGLAGEHNLKTHIAGRRHQAKLVAPGIDAASFRAPLFPGAETTEVNPGAPSGSRKKPVKLVAELQNILDRSQQPMVGLEYIVELRELSNDPSYLCSLCDKTGGKRVMMTHIILHIHRINYLQKHFPNILLKMMDHPDFTINSTIRNKRLKDACKHLENVMGKAKVVVRDYDTFMLNLEENNREIVDGPHGDCRSHQFLNIDLIDDDVPRTRITVYMPGHSDMEFNERKPKVKFESENTLQNRSRRRSRSPPRWTPERLRIAIARQHESIIKPKCLMPKPNKNASKILRERYKRDAIRYHMEMTLYEMEKTFRVYLVKPDLHPCYAEQWKKFWDVKKNDANIATGNFHRDYSKIKRDWLLYFHPIMDEIHNCEIIRTRLEFRVLIKSSENDTNTKTTQTQFSRDGSPAEGSDDSEDYLTKPTKRSRVDPTIEPSTSTASTSSVAIPQTDESMSPNQLFYSQYGTDGSISAGTDGSISAGPDNQCQPSTSTASTSRSTGAIPKTDQSNLSFYRQLELDCTQRNVQEVQSPSSVMTEEIPVKLITVCRLIIDLEIELGQLPQYLLAILAQCLNLKKQEPLTSDDVLLTSFNCNVLNRVRDQITKQLCCNMMPSQKIEAAKRIVINITILIHRAHTINQATEAACEVPPAPEHPIISPDPPIVIGEFSKVMPIKIQRKITKQDVENGLISYYESEVPKDEPPRPILFQQVRGQNTGCSLQDLSDNNLQNLFKTFSTLPHRKQFHLFAYLKRIETEDYFRVSKLNLFLNCRPIEIQVQQITVSPEELSRVLLHQHLHHPMGLILQRTFPVAVQVNEFVEHLLQVEEDVEEDDEENAGEVLHIDESDDENAVAEAIDDSDETPEPVEIDDYDGPEALDVEDSDEEPIEIGDSDEEIPGVEDSDEEIPEVGDSDEEIPEVGDSDEEIPEVGDSDEEIPDVGDSDEEIPEVGDSDEEIPELGDLEEVLAVPTAGEEVEKPEEEIIQVSDDDQESNIEIKDSDEELDSDSDMEDDDESDMDADDGSDMDADRDSDMDADEESAEGSDDENIDESDNEDAHEPIHDPADDTDDEPADDVDEDPAEEEIEEPNQEANDQPAADINNAQANEVNHAQAKDLHKDSGEESDDEQSKEFSRNFITISDSDDDGYDDAEVIRKLINLTTFDDIPKHPISFQMEIPSTSQAPKELLHSLQESMKKAFNAPVSVSESDSDSDSDSPRNYCHRIGIECQLECNMATYERLNRPYENSKPIFRCKKPRLEEMKPIMDNNASYAQRYHAQVKTNYSYFHQLYSKNDNDDDDESKRNNRR